MKIHYYKPKNGRKPYYYVLASDCPTKVAKQSVSKKKLVAWLRENGALKPKAEPKLESILAPCSRTIVPEHGRCLGFDSSDCPKYLT